MPRRISPPITDLLMAFNRHCSLLGTWYLRLEKSLCYKCDLEFVVSVYLYFRKDKLHVCVGGNLPQRPNFGITSVLLVNAQAKPHWGPLHAEKSNSSYCAQSVEKSQKINHASFCRADILPGQSALHGLQFMANHKPFCFGVFSPTAVLVLSKD